MTSNDGFEEEVAMVDLCTLDPRVFNTGQDTIEYFPTRIANRNHKLPGLITFKLVQVITNENY